MVAERERNIITLLLEWAGNSVNWKLCRVDINVRFPFYIFHVHTYIKCYINFGPKCVIARRRRDRSIKIYTDMIKMTSWDDLTMSVWDISTRLDTIPRRTGILKRSFVGTREVKFGIPCIFNGIHVGTKNHRNRKPNTRFFRNKVLSRESVKKPDEDMKFVSLHT